MHLAGRIGKDCYWLCYTILLWHPAMGLPSKLKTPKKVGPDGKATVGGKSPDNFNRFRAD
jgi:hypothetical protein